MAKSLDGWPLLFRLTRGVAVNSNEIQAETGSNICTTITSFKNTTYPVNTTVPEFSVTWSYPFRVANASALPKDIAPAVHAFPQARIAGNSVLPIKIEDIGALNLNVSWTMGVGQNRSYATSARKLGAHDVNSTVALDMYIDADKGRAAEADKASFEVIVFFARFSDANPVGFGNGTIIRTSTLDGTDL